MFTLLSLQADSLTAATSTAVIENVAPNTEISVLEFILKGGVFLIPIAMLLFYTFYVIAERYMYIDKASKIDDRLLRDVGEQLQSGNIELARAIVERSTNASSTIIKEGILDRAADIEIGQMEKHLGHLGLIAGIAPTLGFIGTISGVIKIFYSISVTENISIGNISGGLYEKMISSGAGLIVGIIAYSAYHLLNGKIDNFALKVQKQILEFVNIIQRA